MCASQSANAGVLPNALIRASILRNYVCRCFVRNYDMIYLRRKDDLPPVHFFSEFTHHPPIFTASRSFVHGECPVAPFPMHTTSSDKVLIPHAPSRLTCRMRPTDLPPALRRRRGRHRNLPALAGRRADRRRLPGGEPAVSAGRAARCLSPSMAGSTSRLRPALQPRNPGGGGTQAPPPPDS